MKKVITKKVPPELTRNKKKLMKGLMSCGSKKGEFFGRPHVSTSHTNFVIRIDMKS